VDYAVIPAHDDSGRLFREKVRADFNVLFEEQARRRRRAWAILLAVVSAIVAITVATIRS